MKHVSADDSRAVIFGRIKESLSRLPTPPAAPPVPRGGLDALPPVSDDPDGRVRSLAMRLEELGASFALCDESAQVADGLDAMFGRSGWARILALRSKNLEALLQGVKTPLTWVTAGTDAATLTAMDAAVVEADAVDAQFGAVFCGGTPGGLETVSLAPHLIVVVAESKLYGEYDRALRAALAAANGGGVTSLTGSSVNQNIERRPVMRGHGPQSLTVILCRE